MKNNYVNFDIWDNPGFLGNNSKCPQMNFGWKKVYQIDRKIHYTEEMHVFLKNE